MTADAATTIVGGLAGIAALIAAIVGYLVRKDTRKAKTDEQKLDFLQLGQTALKDALAQAALDNDRLRRRLDLQEREFEEDRTEWRRKMIELTVRLEQAEKGKNECLAKCDVMHQEILELRGSK